MGKYEVQIQGVKLTVTLIDHAALIDNSILEFKTLLQKRRVAGLDVKFNHRSTRKAEILILCVGNRCLVIQLGHLGSIPESLKKFVGDETIYFCRTEMSRKDVSIGKHNLRCKTGVELGHLAARILKKPHISSFGVAKLAREAGLNSVSTGLSGNPPSWSGRAFSNEQIMFAIDEAYTCYVIGNKLLGMLDE
ncbi:hypothetical protein Patl1_22437 [Pistacia atlantica]|uniref:Uncharacterized protein n=1 Tax=Pistacia atlantica TaxID=434234 RepID=A0ACC0ZVI2_9ROSI|nr:hypothetical protein Patl1_22437 [Pistacia atlantica]